MFGSGSPSELASSFTTLISSNEVMNDIMKIFKYLVESSLLIQSVSETMKNEAKEQNFYGFFGKLLGTLGASLQGNILTATDTIRAGESIIRAGQNF